MMTVIEPVLSGGGKACIEVTVNGKARTVPAKSQQPAGKDVIQPSRLASGSRCSWPLASLVRTVTLTIRRSPGSSGSSSGRTASILPSRSSVQASWARPCLPGPEGPACGDSLDPISRGETGAPMDCIKSAVTSFSRGVNAWASSSNRYRKLAEDGECLMPMADLKNGSLRTDSAVSTEVTHALRDQPEIGPDQIDVRHTVALDWVNGSQGLLYRSTACYCGL